MLVSSHPLHSLRPAVCLFCWLLPFSDPALAQSQPAAAPSVVRASSEATVSSTISGTIKALPFKEGSSFAKGDALAVLDCAIYEAEARAASAQSTGARATLVSREALLKRGGIGLAEVEVARAASASAKAKADSADLQLRGCNVTAPYDGRVAHISVNEFEYVETSSPILSIVSNDAPSLEVIAPAKWLRWLRIGAKGTVELDALQGAFIVSIRATGPVIDPVSRTVKMWADFDEPVDTILPGMSGVVRFEEAQ